MNRVMYTLEYTATISAGEYLIKVRLLEMILILVLNTSF